eukprot:scaffold12089_cov176-Ochromonas_danica.AAC.12
MPHRARELAERQHGRRHRVGRAPAPVPCEGAAGQSLGFDLIGCADGQEGVLGQRLARHGALVGLCDGPLNQRAFIDKPSGSRDHRILGNLARNCAYHG